LTTALTTGSKRFRKSRKLYPLPNLRKSLLSLSQRKLRSPPQSYRITKRVKPYLRQLLAHKLTVGIRLL
jgi:hypothetical protein